MHRSDVIVLGPAGWFDAAVAIAACRAGASGFLDLEYAPPDAARSTLRQLDRFTTVAYGIKVGPEAARHLDDWLADRPRLSRVILAGGDHAELPALVALLRRHERQVLLEAVSVAEARRGVELDVDGLILKGQESGGRVGPETSFILLQRWLAESDGDRRPVYVQGGIGANTAAACVLAGA